MSSTSRAAAIRRAESDVRRRRASRELVLLGPLPRRPLESVPPDAPADEACDGSRSNGSSRSSRSSGGRLPADEDAADERPPPLRVRMPRKPAPRFLLRG